MESLTHLPNIGKELDQQLHAVGIENEGQLRAAGSREAWLRIRSYDPSACYMRLCSLEGALQGLRWHHLSPEIKAELKAFYQKYKS
jgi:DNA transformation protein